MINLKIKFNNYETNALIFGVYLIASATIGYIIAGNLGKYFFLCIGFFVIFLKSGNIETSRRYFNILYLSAAYYSILFLVSFLNSHKINSLSIVFGIICFFLFHIGFTISNNLKKGNNHFLSKKVIYVASLITIIGMITLIRFQSKLILESGINIRGYGEESELNPVGVSYVFGTLFLINFSLLKKIVDLKNKKLNILLVLALIASVISMITTLSRGGLLFLAFFFTIYFIFTFRPNKSFFRNFLIFIVVIIVLGFMTNYVSDYFPLIQEKIEQVETRFLSLFNFLEKTSSDASSVERLNHFNTFEENLNELILFGLNNYQPYPHNQFIEIIMRWGLFGLPLLAFSVYIFLKSFRFLKVSIREKNWFAFMIISLFIFSYLQSMTSLSLEMNRFLWLGFGFVFGLDNSRFDNDK